jgi:hypothetical protein
MSEVAETPKNNRTGALPIALLRAWPVVSCTPLLVLVLAFRTVQFVKNASPSSAADTAESCNERYSESFRKALLQLHVPAQNGGIDQFRGISSD